VLKEGFDEVDDDGGSCDLLLGFSSGAFLGETGD